MNRTSCSSQRTARKPVAAASAPSEMGIIEDLVQLACQTWQVKQEDKRREEAEERRALFLAELSEQSRVWVQQGKANEVQKAQKKATRQELTEEEEWAEAEEEAKEEHEDAEPVEETKVEYAEPVEEVEEKPLEAKEEEEVEEKPLEAKDEEGSDDWLFDGDPYMVWSSDMD